MSEDHPHQDQPAETRVRCARFLLGPWLVDPVAGTLIRRDKPNVPARRLQPKTMELLSCLARDPGLLKTKEELLEAVWGEAFVEEGVLAQSIYSLRKALGDDARSPKYIETSPRRGYRLIGVVDFAKPDREHVPRESGGGDRRVLESPRQAYLLPGSLLIAVVLVALLGLSTQLMVKKSTEPVPLQKDDSLYVHVRPVMSLAPAEVTAPNTEYLALSLAEYLERDLNSYGASLITDPAALQAIDHPRDSKPRVFEVTCTLLWRSDADEVVVDLKLDVVDPESRRLETESFTDVALDPLVMARAAAASICATTRCEARRPGELIYGQLSRNLAARQAYLRGLSKLSVTEFNTSRVLEAIKEFDVAIGNDPAFVVAYAELAKAHSHLCFNQRPAHCAQARESLIEARKRDDSPHGVRQVQLAGAYVAMWVDHDQASAIEIFEDVTSGLDSSQDGEILRAAGFAYRRLGQLDQALKLLRRAFEINPLDARLAGTIAKTEAGRRAYRRAEAAFVEALELDPHQPSLLGDRAVNLLALGGCPTLGGRCSVSASRAVLESAVSRSEVKAEEIAYITFVLDLFEAGQLSGSERQAELALVSESLGSLAESIFNGPDGLSLSWRQAWLAGRLGDQDRQRVLAGGLRDRLATTGAQPLEQAHLALAHALLGDAEEALAAGRLAMDTGGAREKFTSPRYEEFLAVVHMLLGDEAAALACLEALMNRDYQYALSKTALRLDPLWDPLRSSPRFQQLLR